MVADRIDRLRFSPSSGVFFAVFSGVSYKREEKKKLSYFSSLFLVCASLLTCDTSIID